ncbi:MAG: NTP transferase domain-containing protein [Candidatus Eisenbacteria bacterium]|nr:NTP transferase domain-containing protein [Candidatus Eisenbacteria bacterium]
MASAVVLAAGESKRLGMKKEVLPIDGVPMIRQIVGRLLDSKKIDEVVVVLGAEADEVGTSLAGVLDERLELVGNARYTEGVGSSIGQGVSACSWEASPILIVPGDTPFFTTDDVDALVDAHSQGARIAVPVLDGRRGHPQLFDGSYREELESLSGDSGARDIVEKEGEAVVEVERDDEGFLIDVDTMDDYQAVKAGL